ncbi:16S rRNA (guanine(966)-N(2))-methyltransferase RsmD, partial [Candidatus Acetothermia bacterium]
GRRFDLIFIGAPYSQGLTQEALKLLSHHNLLREGGLLVVEVHKSETLAPRYGDLVQIQDRDYGDSRLVFYEFVTGEGSA